MIGISKEIEKSVLHITSTIGEFDWSTPSPNSPIFGDNNEDIWAIYKTFEEIYKVMKDVSESIDYLKFHWKFQTSILSSPVHTLYEAINRIVTSTGLLDFENKHERFRFEKRLVQCKKYGDIPIVCNEFEFDLIITSDIMSYGILHSPNFIIPTNQFSQEIESALTIFVLHKYNLITNLKDFYNEN